MRHPAWPLSIGRQSRDRNMDALQRIADTLRIPVKKLWDTADAEHYPDETAEMLRLWFKIVDPDIKQRLIDAARKAAGE